MIFHWLRHEQRDAPWVYLRTKHKTDKTIAASCRAAMIREADERVDHCGKTGFRWTMFPYRPVGVGSLSAPDGVSLVRAHVLTGDKKYLRAAVLTCQFGAGANPLNMCFTTGLGHRSPLHPLHLDSRLTGQPPPPGLTVFGPKDMTSKWEGWGKPVCAPHCTPEIDGWPGVEAYFDVFWYSMQCEFTIHVPMAVNAYTWGYLSARK
jgi:endoglucanase